MANDYSGLIIPILAQGLKVLRTRAIFSRLVNNDYSQDAVKAGQVIQIPAHQSASSYNVVPSSTPLAGADTTVSLINLPINQWKGSSLTLTGQDLQAFDRGAIMPSVAACVTKLSEDVHAHICSLYTGVYGTVGTAGTTPFGSATPQDAVSLAKQLTVQKAPMVGRNVLLDPTAAGNAKMVPAFHNQQYAPTSETARTGMLGQQFGFNWYEVHTVPTHTVGTAAGYLVNGAAVTAGLSTIPVDTGTGNFVVGDIITFAGHTQTYTITAAYAGGAGNISISPALRVSVADNAAITRLGSHTVNLGFHPDAIAFASRKEVPSMVPGTVFESMVDDDPENGTGLALNIEWSRQNKQDLMQLTIQWGAVLQRPDLACRLLG